MNQNYSHFERAATAASVWSGSTTALVIAASTIAIWGITGPFFGFSDTWQLVINTSTTIVTFLMVFLIQRAQNKDSKAFHLKLNEIVAALPGASNRLINIEDLSEKEIRILHEHFSKLSELAGRDNSLTQSHSVEEARDRHEAKQQLPTESTDTQDQLLPTTTE